MPDDRTILRRARNLTACVAIAQEAGCSLCGDYWPSSRLQQIARDGGERVDVPVIGSQEVGACAMASRPQNGFVSPVGHSIDKDCQRK